jgi:hypothetical protein
VRASQEAALWAARHVRAFKDAHAKPLGRPVEDRFRGSQRVVYWREDVQEFLEAHQERYRAGAVPESKTRMLNRLIRESPEYRLWASQSHVPVEKAG